MSDPKAPDGLRQHAVAEYICELAGQMSAMASGVDLDFLSYLLDMARIEAGLAMERTAATRPDNGPAPPAAPKS